MITFVWNAPVRLVDSTFPFGPYVEGFREIGVDVVTVCPEGTHEQYPHAVQCFAHESELTRPQYWRSLGCQAAAIVTWHRMTNILTAIRDAKVGVFNICESDGQVSIRHHPWATFRFATVLQPSLRGKLGATKYWLERYLMHGSADGKGIVDNASASDVLAFAGDGGVRTFRQLLRQLGADSLVHRVAWLPYPVANRFCEGPVTAARPDRVIAVGRWDSPQKDPRLLAATIRRLSVIRRATEIVVVGRGSHEQFAEVARVTPQLHLLPVQPPDTIRTLMSECRSVLIPSRWESGPIVASEMLALGGSVVGTAIPNLAVLTEGNRFGRVSSRRSPAALADAVAAEMAAWDTHERDPAAIAGYWRPRVSPSGVARRLLDLLGPRGTDLATGHAGGTSE